MSPFSRASRRAHLGRVLATTVLLVIAGCSRRGDGDVIVVHSPPAMMPMPPATAGVSLPSNRPLEASEELSPRVLRRYAPVSVDTSAVAPAIVDLGRMLYYDPRLSSTAEVSCNTCHPLARYGTTNTPVSSGIFSLKGKRNAPSTYHAFGHFAQFWDGRVAAISEQAKGPLQGADEMGMTPEKIVQVLSGIDGYRDAFALAFGAGGAAISLENVSLAISGFEQGLVTPSRWDRYLNGDRSALSSREKEGAKLFANYGCIVCHTGPYLGGSMFEKLGARLPWPSNDDHGRREVTGLETDDMSFKVPSLRNVAETGPYFHDGSVPTLESAVRLMGHHQLGLELADDEVRDLTAWMHSLTGEIPNDYIQPPALPR